MMNRKPTVIARCRTCGGIDTEPVLLYSIRLLADPVHEVGIAYGADKHEAVKNYLDRQDFGIFFQPLTAILKTQETH